MPDVADAALLKLKRASAFIKGPSGTGTGYLVAPQRIGTALHVVNDWAAEERYPVVLGNGGPTVNARLLAQDPATDAAVLEFKEVVDIEPLPVADSLKPDVAWKGYGFPGLAQKSEATPTGLPIDGQVKDPLTNNDIGQSAILLYSPEVAAGNASPLHGFSGSPVIVEGALVGHLTKHIGDPDDKTRAAFGFVFACPIRAVVNLLDVRLREVAIAPQALATISASVPTIDQAEYHVFVSYRSTDRRWAQGLVARLEGVGLRVFIDQAELQPGDYLGRQLESAMQRSRGAVVLVSKGWLESPWCQQEAQVLEKRAVQDKSFRLVPLRLDSSTMPPFLDTRVWLDFDGMDSAGGQNLERLLAAFVDRAPSAATPAALRADAADVLVIDKFVAEVKSAARTDEAAVLKVVEEWRKTASKDNAPLVAAVEALNGKAMFRRSLQLLEGATDTLRIKQLRAFAVRKLGDIDTAITMFEALRNEGQVDAETGGMLAGSYKAKWLKTGDGAFLQLAYQTYEETYTRYDDPFNGINVASLALAALEKPKSRRVANKIVEELLKRDPAKLHYWDYAALGEGYLLQEDFLPARDWYRKAAGAAAGMPQDIAVMRKQARRNLELLGEPRNKFDDILPVPAVLVYFGHMVDAKDRPQSRFPRQKVGAVRQEIRARLEKWGPLYGFGQAAQGTDLIVLDELLRRSLKATVVLPFPESDFIRISVGDDWSDKYKEIRALVTFAEPLRLETPSADDLPKALARANRQVQKLSVEFADLFDETPLVLAVWDGNRGDGPGGTADAVQLWRDEGYKIEIIDVAKLGN